MKHLRHLLALTLIAVLLTACGDGTTTDPMPEGTAPTEPADTPGQPIDQPAAQPDAGPQAPDPDASEEPEQPAPKPLVIKPTPTPDDAERTAVPGLSFVIPEGWFAGPDNQFRLFTLVAPAELGGAELAVSKWDGNVGGFAANVGRWCNQIGMDPIPGLTTAEDSDFEKFPIDGETATWVPLLNEQNNQAILAIWVPRGDLADTPTETWTLKLTCDADQVQALAPGVRAWAESIKFEPLEQ